jgi:Fe-S cluster assembly scaffold protein SufB
MLKMQEKKKKGIKSLKELPVYIARTAESVGLEGAEKKRSGSFFQLDESAVFAKVVNDFRGQIEIMDTKDALGKYDWLRDYYWKLVDRDKDKYTKKVDEEFMGGYFLRILPGRKITVPIQSCMYISKQKFKQHVHNIIIAEPGCEAQIITGCAVSEDVRAAEHIGVSEFYVRKGAKLTFTMIHNWNMETRVRPRSAAIIEDSASFMSNYVVLNPVKDIQMYPTAKCVGRNSVARFSNLLHAENRSLLDVGSRVELIGDNSRAEVVSRAIAKDNSEIIARGVLESENPTVKAHLECRGLLLGTKAKIHAIPELLATGEGIDMSHEAAVGKIAEKEILYLMSRGLTRDEATALIIRGFLDTRILHLPSALDDMMKGLTEKVAEGL